MRVLKCANLICIDDSFIERIVFDLIEQKCQLRLEYASVLKDGPDPDPFDPEVLYQPALLTLEGMRSISCPEGAYHLNQTVIDFKVEPVKGSDLLRFSFTMTGGTSRIDDPTNTFIRSLVMVAKDFSLRAASEEDLRTI